MRQEISLAQWISWILAGVGVILMGVGLAVMLGVEAVQLLTPHAIPLLLMGILYTLLPLIWAQRRALQQAGVVWVMSLVIASAAAMLSIVLRSDFGNFNPALAEFARSWPQQLPPETVVDIGRSGLTDVCQAQAHAFYTPTPGQFIGDADLQARRFGSHIWISPQQWQALGSQLSDLEAVAELDGWQLMQRSTGSLGTFSPREER
jgi:hypothetical protein